MKKCETVSQPLLFVSMKVGSISAIITFIVLFPHFAQLGFFFFSPTLQFHLTV